MTAVEPQAIEASKAFMQAAERLPRLYHMAAEWNTLLALLEEPDQDPEAIQLELQRLAGDIRAKGHGVAVVIRSLEGMAELEKAEAKRLADKAKANQNHADRLRAYALACMKELDVERIETGIFTLSVRTNPAHVEVLNEPVLSRVEAYETMPDVPPEFVRLITLYKVTKREMLDEFKRTGEAIPGVEISRTESLRIS